jgi:hypothetical protein
MYCPVGGHGSTLELGRISRSVNNLIVILLLLFSLIFLPFVSFITRTEEFIRPNGLQLKEKESEFMTPYRTRRSKYEKEEDRQANGGLKQEEERNTRRSQPFRPDMLVAGDCDLEVIDNLLLPHDEWENASILTQDEDSENPIENRDSLIELFDSPEEEEEGSEASFKPYWEQRRPIPVLREAPECFPNRRIQERQRLPFLNLNDIDHLLPEDPSVYLLPL